MENIENSPKLKLTNEPTAKTLQEDMNMVADKIFSLRLLVTKKQKEFEENPSLEIKDEIDVAEKQVAKLQQTLQAFSIREKSAEADVQTGPWSDLYVGGRNGAARNIKE